MVPWKSYLPCTLGSGGLTVALYRECHIVSIRNLQSSRVPSMVSNSLFLEYSIGHGLAVGEADDIHFLNSLMVKYSGS